MTCDYKETHSYIVAADAACDVEVPGIPSSYVDDDENSDKETRFEMD
jgi:hypothetical protein